MMMPILPFINDTVDNVRSIVEKAHEYHLNYIYPSFGVTLRGRQREHFYGKIGKELTKKYRDTFGDSYMCSSPNSNELQSEFIRLCEKYGILYKMKDIIEASKKHIVEQQIQFEI